MSIKRGASVEASDETALRGPKLSILLPQFPKYKCGKPHLYSIEYNRIGQSSQIGMDIKRVASDGLSQETAPRTKLPSTLNFLQFSANCSITILVNV